VVIPNPVAPALRRQHNLKNGANVGEGSAFSS